MEIPNISDKMMDGTASINKSPTLTWFFFPGGGQWKEMTIEAASREEAEKIYQAKREPVNPSDESGKVGDSKETINE